MRFKNKKGASLLLGISFSISILILSSLISAAMLHTQKNIKNIEDSNIAFFLAEAAMEEALYYNSFHDKGFSASNNNDSYGWEIFNNNEINNVFYQWNIQGTIDDTNSLSDRTGSILFGKASTFNFSFDNSTKTTTSNYDNTNNTNGSNITFAIHSDFNEKLQPETHAVDGSDYSNIVLTWEASYLNSSGIEDKLYYGNVFADRNTKECSTRVADGKAICQDTIINSIGTCNSYLQNCFFANGLNFNIDNTNISGLWEKADGSKITKKIYSDFFLDNNQNKRKVKFFFIKTIKGTTGNPDLDKIYYRVNVPSGSTMTALRSTITATGRSRNILSTIQVKIDNTQEYASLDYITLFE